MSYTTRTIKIGGFAHVEPVLIGGGNPVVIQTMWKDRLSFSCLEGEAGRATLARISRLAGMGCGLLRFAVPDLAAADALGALAGMTPMPLVADIHFDYKIALRCLDFLIAKIRINPGNIGSRDKVEKVLSKAALKKAPIRIGVNAGSLPADLRPRVDSGELGRARALVMAAERELAVFGEFGFEDVLVSMKASSAAETIRANRLLAGNSGTGGPAPPLHIGVTEAGPLIAGVARNAAALCALLSGGIGDTIRVSLSDSMENEVIAGREILALARELAASCPADSSANSGNTHAGAGILREYKEDPRPAATIISCPRCGRNSFDTHGFTARWLNRLYALKKRCTIAVMGCAVNGPEEARHADLGITGAGGKVLIFLRGKVVRTVDAARADEAFAEELEKL
ncbi:MAG: (E)-4-hydroxy-3-methylbut-2-enyl-diphosphate synthase [Spirochaetaceae bacterium]|nr:(E)-4-hydroxy-3-methylbut-2-enyl-diphosphate synthase [Spirochaetaceae bacterium]